MRLVFLAEETARRSPCWLPLESGRVDIVGSLRGCCGVFLDEDYLSMFFDIYNCRVNETRSDSFVLDILFQNIGILLTKHRLSMDLT